MRAEWYVARTITAEGFVFCSNEIAAFLVCMSHQPDCRIRICISHQLHRSNLISYTNHSVWELFFVKDVMESGGRAQKMTLTRNFGFIE